MAKHHEEVAPFSVHVVYFKGPTDPALDEANFVGPGKQWWDTSTDPETMKCRNDADDDWDLMYEIGASGGSGTVEHGTGSPEGVVTADVGTLYVQEDATLPMDGIWYKKTGSGNTGWVQVTASAGDSGAAFAGVRIFHSLTQSIATSGTAQAMTFDSEDFDTDAYHSGGAPTRLTVPAGKAGKYLIVGYTNWAANATGSRRLQIRLNGATTLTANESGVQASGGSASTGVAALVTLAVGDYVELMATEWSAGALNASAGVTGNNFAMHLIQSGSSGGLPLGGATGQILAKQSNDDGDADWVDPPDSLITTPSTIYIATTGDDDTGDGSEGDPYETLEHALSLLPNLISQTYTIVAADGTYAEPIDVSRFVGTGDGEIVIVGDVANPANVSFTGTVGVVFDGFNHTTGCKVDGPVKVKLQGVRVNVTAVYGYAVLHRAHVILDRVLSAGTLSQGLLVGSHSLVELTGNNTFAGWSAYGINLQTTSRVVYMGAGTLTATGPGGGSTTAEGINLGYQSLFHVTAADVHIVVTGIKYGVHTGIHGAFQHYGASGSITIDNATTPSDSAAVLGNDVSTFSTNNPFTVDHFVRVFELNSISYAEAISTKTFTFITLANSVTQNSVAYLP